MAGAAGAAGGVFPSVTGAAFIGAAGGAGNFTFGDGSLLDIPLDASFGIVGHAGTRLLGTGAHRLRLWGSAQFQQLWGSPQFQRLWGSAQLERVRIHVANWYLFKGWGRLTKGPRVTHGASIGRLHTYYIEQLHRQEGAPIIHDPRLRDTVAAIFKDGIIGDGTSFDAVFYERVARVQVGGAWHWMKVSEFLDYLEKQAVKTHYNVNDQHVIRHLIWRAKHTLEAQWPLLSVHPHMRPPSTN